MGRPGGDTQGAVWVLTDFFQPHLRAWGLSTVERLRRALVAAGFTEECIKLGPVAEADIRAETVLVVRGDYVFDERLVRALVTADGTVLADRQQAVAARVRGEQVAAAARLLCGKEPAEAVARRLGARCVQPVELTPGYTAALRKAAPPYLFRARSEDIAEIEARIFAASYKGVTDFVTKWVWPQPASAVVRRLADAGVRPNSITLLSLGLVILTTWLFATGHFGVGLVAAWLMTFLDTVDGKLARVTLTSSRLGHVLDHGLDLLHPPFWYLAWAVGLYGDAAWRDTATPIVLGGYVIGRLIEGLFLLAFKMEIHSWRPVDSFFRTITARRNPNLFLLTLGAVAGRPGLGLGMVAGWTLFSIGFHTVRLVQAYAQRRHGQHVGVWQALPAAAGDDVPSPDRSESLV